MAGQAQISSCRDFTGPFSETRGAASEIGRNRGLRGQLQLRRIACPPPAIQAPHITNDEFWFVVQGPQV
ncbi:MAG: hypothetical protein ACI8Y4_002073 [Candidatus Poriferisodalaceae bacterium]